MADSIHCVLSHLETMPVISAAHTPVAKMAASIHCVLSHLETMLVVSATPLWQKWLLPFTECFVTSGDNAGCLSHTPKLVGCTRPRSVLLNEFARRGVGRAAAVLLQVRVAQVPVRRVPVRLVRGGTRRAHACAARVRLAGLVILARQAHPVTLHTSAEERRRRKSTPTTT